MSKYIKEDTTITSSEFLWVTGMIELCIYLAASFPGTPLFGSLPMSQISLYIFLGQSLVVFLFASKTGIYTTTHFIWYGIFTIASFLFLIFSDGEIVNGCFYAIITCFILTTVQSMYITNEKGFKTICWSYIMICIINTLLLIATNSLELKGHQRLGSNININPNLLATKYMYGIVYALWLFLFEKRRVLRIILFFSIIIMFYPLVLTGGRKFFIAPIVFFLLIFMSRGNVNSIIQLAKNILIVCIVLFIIWQLIMNIPVLYNSLGNRMEGLLNAITGEGEIDQSTKIRGQLRALALQGWSASPVWGYGLDTFKYRSVQNGFELAYSHCNYTELLYGGGLILFILYYWFYGFVLKEGFVNKSIDIKYRSFCVAGIVMQFIYDYGGVSYNMYDNQLFILLIFCAANGMKNSLIDCNFFE